jgi:hypothetical protein
MGRSNDAAPLRAYSVSQFAKAHNISTAMFYKLLKQGHGPVVMRVGTRTLISIEAAEAWRRKREAAHKTISGRFS